MRILIQSSGEKAIKITLPTRMLFNSLTASIGAKAIRRYVSTDDVKLSSADLRRLMKEINKIKKRFPGLLIVDVESSDGDIVKISL